ncbi:MAG: hypothetical protein M1814_005447 [Vezdaea aestivalis]|nr:MAG: hypothetical protein M1814_005447 [Vezdaea aestivalis]
MRKPSRSHLKSLDSLLKLYDISLRNCVRVKQSLAHQDLEPALIYSPPRILAVRHRHTAMSRLRLLAPPAHLVPDVALPIHPSAQMTLAQEAPTIAAYQAHTPAAPAPAQAGQISSAPRPSSLNVVSPGVSSTSQTGGATSSASASKSSLSTGIKATIAVAVIVLAAIVAGIAFFIYRHRKQARSIFTGSVGGSAAPNGVAAAGSGRPGPHHARSQSYSTTAAATVRPGMATMDSNRSGQEPRPEPGPYTVGPNDNMHSTSPGVAVPAHPEGPGDFVQPIEIGPGLPKEPEGQPPVELP